MIIHKIPDKLKTIIFDIDGTLYTNKLYVFEQVDVQIRHFAHIKGISEKEARHEIESYRKTYAASHEGKKISLGNTLLAFGISIEESIDWCNKLLEPHRFLHKDIKLIKTLSKLKEKYFLIALTNNPVLAAQKTLDAIGIKDYIPEIIGLDSCMKSKPSKENLELAVKLSHCKKEECLCIGDRYDIDIALPLTLGMGGITVKGVEEVYCLPDILNTCSP